eukprot:GHVS01045075.1.p2 GENE.GHVS01045075.1~~GHVS01045075.1.p2  ORF type:complete len:119 (+),score=11.84 GHVS01045075.1:88-444(+)
MGAAADDSMVISQVEVDISHQRFPYCVVWTCLPGLTTFLPFIGHTGICTSDGVIHDFGGPYYIGIDDMTFGKPLMYWNLSPGLPAPPDRCSQLWDSAVNDASSTFRQRQVSHTGSPLY